MSRKEIQATAVDPAIEHLSVLRSRLKSLLSHPLQHGARIDRSIVVGMAASMLSVAVLTPFLSSAEQVQVRPIIKVNVETTPCSAFDPREFIVQGGGNIGRLARTDERTWNYDDSSNPVSNVAVPDRIVVTNLKTQEQLLPGYPLYNGDNFSISCHEPVNPIEGEVRRVPSNALDAEQSLGGIWKQNSGNSFSRVEGPVISIVVPDEVVVIADRPYLPGDQVRISKFSVTHHPRPTLPIR